MNKLLSYVALLTVALGCGSRPEQTTNPPGMATPGVDAPAADTTIVDDTRLTATPGASPDNFHIIPGEQVGMITAESSEATLIEQLGRANVTPGDSIYIGEGERQLGTTLFKGTPDQAQILWKDPARRARPDAVILRPDTLKPGTAGRQPQWATDSGLRIGSTLRDVEQINGRAFTLYGFGWDYGGTVADWKGGRLQAPDGRSYLSVVFAVQSLSRAGEKMYTQVLGDAAFSSALPAMNQLNPVVQRMTLRF